MIPCVALKIGGWRRSASALPPSSLPGQHDLAGYTCEKRQILTWFIHSSDISSKMELAYDSIVTVEFHKSSSEGLENAVIIISQPPTFYRRVRQPSAWGGYVKGWVQCDDWTGGGQASVHLRHEVVGLSGYLLAALQIFPCNTRGLGNNVV